jgi:1-acyl-sn-glycerol-3-phosphate acyltransferase
MNDVDQRPRRYSPFMRWFGGWTLRAIGWKSAGELPNIPKFVACVAPHTSNWDVVVCAGYMFREQLQLSFLAKHTVFFWPLSIIMHWIGAVPVDRRAASGIVGGVIQAFNAADKLIIAVAPEGTRKANSTFKAGFLHMALGAKVPVLLVTLDVGDKVLRIGELFHPTGDIAADLAHITAYYAPYQKVRLVT